MPSHLISLSLDPLAFDVLESLQPPGGRARSLVVRCLLLASAFQVFETPDLLQDKIDAPPDRMTFTVSMDADTSVVFRKLVAFLGIRQVELLRRAVNSPDVVRMANALIMLDSRQRREFAALLIPRFDDQSKGSPGTSLSEAV